MPEISRFLGIVIAMFYKDQEPAHFHAYYGEFEITVGIDDGNDKREFPAPRFTITNEARGRSNSKRWSGSRSC